METAPLNTALQGWLGCKGSKRAQLVTTSRKTVIIFVFDTKEIHARALGAAHTRRSRAGPHSFCILQTLPSQTHAMNQQPGKKKALFFVERNRLSGITMLQLLHRVTRRK